ncbi:MAG: hypothetical protein F8N15_00350 [Methanobacterium sp.]|nr:hypothetical protein [Methanobacterium sp.]
MDAPDLTRRVLIVLDPNFGERLKEIWRDQPVWIVMSSVNDPVIQSIWADSPGQSHLTGVTGMPCYESRGAEGCFLAYLDDIDLHHGPYSTKTPYTALKVIGAPLTSAIRCALSELGFVTFSEDTEGFDATRSAAEAKRIRP